jgi:hypothetical protein
VTASDDILDDAASPIAHQFDAMIKQSESTKRQALITQMSQPAQTTSADSSAAGQPAPDYWFLSQPTTVSPAQAQSGAQDDTQTTNFPLTDPTPIAIPSAATPTDEEAALLAERRTEDDQADATTSHLKTIKTPEQIAEEAKQAQAEAARQAAEAAAAAHRAKEAEEAGKAQVTTDRQVAIMNLASRDDQDVATLSRRAQKEIKDNDDGEVVIPLR